MRSSVRRSSAALESPRKRRGQIQRVLHVARGMLGRHVQRVEAVPLVFDLRTFDDGETHAREDGFHAFADERERMAMAERGRAARQRDVDRAGWTCARARRDSSERRPARFDRLLQFVGEAADLALLRPAVRRASCCIHPATTLFLRPRYRSRTACASRADAACASSASNAADVRVDGPSDRGGS